LDLTIESDWFTALGAVVLFILFALLLLREIDHFIWGHVGTPVRLHISFWNIWNKVFEAIAAIYCFIFAFQFRNRYLKAGSLFMGMNLAGFVVLSCFQLPARALHIAAVSGSAVRQVALAILCIAIAQWLRSVVRWGGHSEVPGGEN
jgi:hypothetical protein